MSRGFSLSAMKFPAPLEEFEYGNPERVLERRREIEAAERAKAERKKSPARKAAESLFEPLKQV